MMMSARTIEAPEAQQLGLVDVLAPTGKLDEALQEFITPLLANSWFTNFAVKRFMIETEGMSLAAALAHEFDRYPGRAPDYEQRLAAFKRPSH
jgi:enoyl-CoA hydratase/carnithine racemase